MPELTPEVAAYRLWATPGVGNRTVARLLEHYGELAVVLEGPPPEDPRLRRAYEALRSPRGDEGRTLAHWRRYGELLTPFSPDYPERLRRLAAPPLLLFWRGVHPARWPSPSVALVGARRATPYGLAVAERFARELADRGAAVGSGLALGIDGAAHRGALAAEGCTWAVMGTGLDQIYPAEHRGLARRILEAGGTLLTPFPPGTEVSTRNFPARNAVIAGLADAVVVVEGRRTSGARITADHALEAGVEVLAVPGRIDDPLAEAPLALLAAGAKPALSVDAILEAAGWVARRKAAAPVEAPLPDRHREILAAIPASEAIHVDELAVRLGTSPAALAADLLELELAGWVRAWPGRYYARATPALAG